MTDNAIPNSSMANTVDTAVTINDIPTPFTNESKDSNAENVNSEGPTIEESGPFQLDENGQITTTIESLISNFTTPAVSPTDPTEMIKKFMDSGNGQVILDEAKKLGIDPKLLMQKMAQYNRAMKAKAPHKGDKTTTVVVLNSKRQFKEQTVIAGFADTTASTLLGGTAVEIKCTRMAVGPLAGKTVKVWYLPDDPKPNRRAKRLTGFKAGSNIIIGCDDGPVTTKMITAVEKILG